MRLLDLPVDVLATILDFIDRDRSSLSALCRVSSALSIHATALLYRSISLYTVPGFVRFKRTLETRPELGTYVHVVAEKQLVFAFLPQCAFRHSQRPLAFVEHTPNLRRLELMTPFNPVWSSELMKLRLRSFCAINLCAPALVYVSRLDMFEMEYLELRFTGNIPVEDLIFMTLGLWSSAPSLRRLRLQGTIYEVERVLELFPGVDVAHVEAVSHPCILEFPLSLRREFECLL
ncbi:hypothetical protein EXIGLDRAFT_717964 [Exidia glandulosa HHB12029]|uniref:F-box domain-containing protein n=1 Tax=Exidia glandulosa HHB12029 TaxID=1314781 RepID=A0A165P2Y1_EXIGL|nr:hypothetical protein EXIGLDRAFT_717964 [Exidia glandulosa HHB12029]